VNGLRAWIVLLALTAFGAGTGAGVLLSMRLHPRQVDSGPFEDYQRRFAAEFDLSAERTRLLGELLATYSAAIEALEQRQLARGMSELEDELEALGREYHGLIRDHVLPPDRRPEFDRRADFHPVL
jgi:hypothetical protein